MKTATYPVITVEEFQQTLMAALLHEQKDCSQEDLFRYMLEKGFPKFDVQNLGTMLRTMKGYIFFLDTVLVDFNDNMFYWMVCGMDAMTVKKPLTKYKK